MGCIEQYNQNSILKIDNKTLDAVSTNITFNNTFQALNGFDSQIHVQVTNPSNKFNLNNPNSTTFLQGQNPLNGSNLKFDFTNNQSSFKAHDLKLDYTNNQLLFQAPNSLKGSNSLKNLDEKQLANYIKKLFQNEDGTRFTYSHMKQDKVYPFIVQSAIDSLCSKLDNTKYNVEGLQDGQGKTLRGWIEDAGGIYNNSKTRDVVKIVQRILDLKPVDGLAGPQFFAKICAKLTGEPMDQFNVEGYDQDNNKYKPNLDREIVEGQIERKEAAEIAEVKDNIKKINEYYEKPGRNRKDVIAIKHGLNRTYYGIDKNISSVYYQTDIVDKEPQSLSGWFDTKLSSDYKDVENAMNLRGAFCAFDVRYNEVLALKNAYMGETKGNWPTENDDLFLDLANKHMTQKWYNNHNKKQLAKWCVKKDSKSMGRDFLERGEKMTKKGLPADKITIKTRITLRNIDGISQIIV